MKHVLLLFFFLLSGLALQAQRTAKGVDLKPNLSVFPNPATEYISVQDANEVISEIWVFNLVGKKMKAFEFAKEGQYYVADLPKGMYLVQLVDRSQKVVNTQKLNKR